MTEVAEAPGVTCECLAAFPPCPLSSIVDNLQEIVFQTDAQGRWTFLNRTWEKLTGFPVEETLGRFFADFIHRADRASTREKFRPLLERREEFCRREVRYLTRDGGFRWMEARVQLRLDSDGQMIGTSGTLSDITERKKKDEELYEARRRLEFLLASNPAVIFASRSGSDTTPWETTYISDNVRTLLGISREQFTSDPGFWITTVHPEDLAEVYRSMSELAARGQATARYRSRCEGSPGRWMRCDTRLVSNPAAGTLETFGCLVDETHSRQIEQSLRSHAAILEAVGAVGQLFLDAASWRNEIGTVLERLGVAAGVSRVHVFENSRAGQEVVSSPRYEWTMEGVVTLMAEPELGGLPFEKAGFGRWVGLLGRGEPVYGRVADFPVCEQERLEPKHVKALLVVPIFTGREWWGFIGFDDCERERDWPRSEIDALRTAAGILGAAIHRDQTQSALRQSEAFLKTMTDSSPLGFYVVDNRTDRILYFNDRFCEIWKVQHLGDRLRRGELANQDLIFHCVPMLDDVPAFAATCEPLQEEQNRSVVADYIAFRDGRTIRRFSTQIRDAADTYFGRLYLFEDVTEQRHTELALLRTRSELEARVLERTAELEHLNERLRGEIAERGAAEQALATREAHFRTLIENSSDLIFVTDDRAVLGYVSPAVTRFLGYQPEDLIGKSGLEFIHARDRARVAARFREGLSVEGTHLPLEFQIRGKDGTYRVVEAIGNNQLANPVIRAIVITLRDITDRRRLEEQFRQAQKMEAVGRLAGGVAHDFNNLLTVICGYSELLEKRLPEGEPLRRKAGLIKRAGDRATALVQQLLAFSRKQVVQAAPLDVNEAIADLDKMMRRLIGEDIELTIVPAPEPVCVLIDRTQFDQILMNLSVNARDAMPEGGALSISVAVRRRCDTGGSGPARDVVELTVRDTGVGIVEEARAHIFEPFFTTKEVGKGTGLGLSMVYG
ncbi:MAG TPA: PAS domain S-box protein, partial [Bryobacteraceae bacterium]